MLVKIQLQIKKRIFSRGIASDGTPIGRRRDGVPSRLYDTGVLSKNFRVDEGGIYLKNPRENNIKVTANEERFNKDIISLTNEEADLLSEVFMDMIETDAEESVP